MACKPGGRKLSIEINFVLFFFQTKATKLNSLRKFLLYSISYFQLKVQIFVAHEHHARKPAYATPPSLYENV